MPSIAWSTSSAPAIATFGVSVLALLCRSSRCRRHVDERIVVLSMTRPSASHTGWFGWRGVGSLRGEVITRRRRSHMLKLSSSRASPTQPATRSLPLHYHGLRHAECVPLLEGTHLVRKAPLDRVVHRNDVVGNLRDAARGVREPVVQRRADVLACAVLRPDHRLESRAKRLQLAVLPHRVEADLRRRLVLQRFEVQRPELLLAVLLDALVEPRAGLIASKRRARRAP